MAGDIYIGQGFKCRTSNPGRIRNKVHAGKTIKNPPNGGFFIALGGYILFRRPNLLPPAWQVDKKS